MPSLYDDYPATVAEVLDQTKTYRPAALRALRRFKRSKPWRGNRGERLGKRIVLLVELSRAYGIPTPTLVVGQRDSYTYGAHVLSLGPRMSVLSLLHEFAHAKGIRSERGACAWSINLFRRIFPRSFARLVPVGHTLIRPEDLGR